MSEGSERRWRLVETIGGMSRLKRVDCSIGLEEEVSAFEVWRPFVLSAPVSLESLVVSLGLTVVYRDDMDEEGGEETMVVECPLVRELMPALKNISIPPPTEDFTLEERSWNAVPIWSASR